MSGVEKEVFCKDCKWIAPQKNSRDRDPYAVECHHPSHDRKHPVTGLIDRSERPSCYNKNYDLDCEDYLAKRGNE